MAGRLTRIERLHKTERARAMHAEGKSIRAIAEELDHSHRTVGVWLNPQNAERQRAQEAELERRTAHARQRIEEGCTVNQVARELRVDKTTITRWLWPEKRKSRARSEAHREKLAAERKARDEMEAKLMPYDRFKLMMARGDM